ncbi:MAG: tetratricopeptide repeat protein [Bacteroidota bacterium]
MNARGRMRVRLAGTVLLAAALLASGCGTGGRRSERYRVEKARYRAMRAMTEATLGRSRPDSTALLRLRGEFMRVRDVSKPPYLQGTGRSLAVGRDILALVTDATQRGATLAMQAGRPDLALDDSRWLEQHAEGDVVAMRQSDFIAADALRTMGKTNEWFDRLHAMLRRYEPQAPSPGTSDEDPLLTIPETMADARRQAGDQAGADRELEYGIGYFKGLLQKPREPMLEALIRSRIVRTDLERNNGPEALEQLDALERLVASHPDLKSIEPELVYSRAKIRLMTQKGDLQGIAMLEKFASDYPKHVLAARALFDAGLYLESAKKLPDALGYYRMVVARYPDRLDVAPVALFRQAMLEEQTGNWEQAKATLESVPVKYPRSEAAVEAPFTIAMRYYARGDKEGAKMALARAVATYADMIRKDSTSVFVPTCRWNILRGQLSLGEWEQALNTVDDLAAQFPKHPYTAQALLEGARVANANRQKDRAAGYLQQFLENFPDSPVAGQVRQQKDKLLH